MNDFVVARPAIGGRTPSKKAVAKKVIQKSAQKAIKKVAPNPEYRTSKKGLKMSPETLGLPSSKAKTPDHFNSSAYRRK